jgi:hypothetical protein
VRPFSHINRVGLAAVVATLGIGGVGAAVVVAQSDDGNPEDGSVEELRYGSPPRTSPPQVVARGNTDAGQPYVLRTSRADEQLCLEVEYGPYPNPADASDSDGHQGPIASLLTSEVCVDPKRPISASIGQLFVDPETGEVSKKPQRFVYGVVTDKASDVRLRSPAASGRELHVADVPGSSVRVFAGSAPREAGVGVGAVVARGSSGANLAEHPLTFVGPGR